ncbi:MAG: CBS domain-containing protein [Bacillota bacterium]
MVIITSHINLDFDGLASMVAAGKLFPKAKIVLPEKLSPGVQQFLSLYKDSLSLFKPQQINWPKVQTIILVDTSNLQRTSIKMDSIKGAEFIVFDHHINEKGEFAIEKSIIEAIGSTTTLLIEEIIRKNIEVSSFEATIMALGIYSDTGSFLFPHTTPRDLQAAAYLLNQGASQRVVSKFLGTPLLAEDQELLNDLLANSEEFNLRGVELLVAWRKQENYRGSLARLASKILEITGVDALFLIVDMANKVFVVARSATDLLDVSEIVSKFGGGGHPKAASATIKNGNYLKILERVKRQLTLALKPSITARDIMSSPVKTITPETKIEDVSRIMLRYGHTGLPVVKDDKLLGIISRRDVDKAYHHGLGHAPVKGFMTRNVVTISLETSLEEIQKLMINNDIGRLPVINNNCIVGIVSRTDVLNCVHGENIRGEHSISPVFIEKNVIYTLKRVLPEETLTLLRRLGEKGDQLGYSVYIVGGIVRDVLLGKSNKDIDIVVEGNGIKYANDVVQDLGGKITPHEKFCTATLKLHDGTRIDISTARREYYDYPAALPVIEESTIKNDLYRRDFTINAMAIQLNARKFGYLVDYFHGYNDVQQKTLRILYNMSFVEDPTRIIRAVRFEQRLGFLMDPQTLKLAQNSADLISSVSEPRIASELKVLFNNRKAVDAIKRLAFIGVWEYLLENNPLTDTKMAYLERMHSFILHICSRDTINNNNYNFWICYLALLFYNEKDVSWLIKVAKYTLNKGHTKILKDIENSSDKWTLLHKSDNLNMATIHQYFKAVSIEALLFLLSINYSEQTGLILDYLVARENISLPVTGHDLIKYGIKTGPLYSEIFKKMEEAYLNNEFNDKDGAYKWLDEHFFEKRS